MTSRHLALACVAALAAHARAADHDHAGHEHAHGGNVPSLQRAPLAEARAAVHRARAHAPPAPAGVTDLDFAEFFAPVGDRGLEYGEKLRALDGKPVRIVGYMVRQDTPVAGMLLLAPFPFQLHETEYGLAEDLPATLVHVFVPDRARELVPWTPGLLLLTGDLAIGPREEPDGRISTVRLQLHPRAAVPSKTAPRKPKKKERA
jgi:hypothetical protein